MPGEVQDHYAQVTSIKEVVQFFGDVTTKQKEQPSAKQRKIDDSLATTHNIEEKQRPRIETCTEIRVLDFDKVQAAKRSFLEEMIKKSINDFYNQKFGDDILDRLGKNDITNDEYTAIKKHLGFQLDRTFATSSQQALYNLISKKPFSSQNPDTQLKTLLGMLKQERMRAAMVLSMQAERFFTEFTPANALGSEEKQGRRAMQDLLALDKEGKILSLDLTARPAGFGHAGIEIAQAQLGAKPERSKQLLTTLQEQKSSALKDRWLSEKGDTYPATVLGATVHASRNPKPAVMLMLLHLILPKRLNSFLAFTPNEQNKILSALSSQDRNSVLNACLTNLGLSEETINRTRGSATIQANLLKLQQAPDGKKNKIMMAISNEIMLIHYDEAYLKPNNIVITFCDDRKDVAKEMAIGPIRSAWIQFDEATHKKAINPEEMAGALTRLLTGEFASNLLCQTQQDMDKDDQLSIKLTTKFVAGVMASDHNVLSPGKVLEQARQLFTGPGQRPVTSSNAAAASAIGQFKRTGPSAAQPMNVEEPVATAVIKTVAELRK